MLFAKILVEHQLTRLVLHGVPNSGRMQRCRRCLCRSNSCYGGENLLIATRVFFAVVSEFLTHPLRDRRATLLSSRTCPKSHWRLGPEKNGRQSRGCFFDDAAWLGWRLVFGNPSCYSLSCSDRSECISTRFRSLFGETYDEPPMVVPTCGLFDDVRRLVGPMESLGRFRELFEAQIHHQGTVAHRSGLLHGNQGCARKLGVLARKQDMVQQYDYLNSGSRSVKCRCTLGAIDHNEGL